MSATDYSSEGLLYNLLSSNIPAPTFNDSAAGFPTNWYLGASTTTPRFSKGSSPYWNFTEPSDSAYARVETSWQEIGSAPSDAYGMVPQSAPVFPQATVNWGSVTYWGLFDAATLGNLWFYVPMARVVTDGELTSGSTTLQSATADFTSGDVGATVYAPQLPIGTAITAYTSSTEVTLSAEAEATATGILTAIATPVSVTSGNTLQGGSGYPSFLLG